MRPELTEILTTVLEVPSVSERDNHDSIASWDSVRHLTLITALEERFGVSFEADEMMQLTSVAAIVEALGRLGR